MKTPTYDIIEGLIIHSFPYKESHKMVHVFTKNQGVLSLMANGARKPKSKLRGKVETLTHMMAWIQKGKKNPILTLNEVQVKEPFFSKFSFDAFWETLPFLKILRFFHFTHEEENEKIFTMLLKFLFALTQAPHQKSRDFLKQVFVLKAFIILGMISNPRFCSVCGKHPKNAVILDPDDFFITCFTCANNSPKSLLNFGFYQKLVEILYLKFDDLIYFMLDSSNANALKQLSNKILIKTIGKGWKDFETTNNPFDNQS